MCKTIQALFLIPKQRYCRSTPTFPTFPNLLSNRWHLYLSFPHLSLSPLIICHVFYYWGLKKVYPPWFNARSIEDISGKGKTINQTCFIEIFSSLYSHSMRRITASHNVEDTENICFYPHCAKVRLQAVIVKSWDEWAPWPFSSKWRFIWPQLLF